MTYTAEQIAEQISEGELTIQQAAELTGWPIIDDCLVPELNMWHADDGNAEIVEEHDSAEEAAQAYVDGGEWGECNETSWITVRVWREGIDTDGDFVRVDEEHHKIAIEPEEPKCIDGDDEDHDWHSPYEIVGGIKENPGVWGSGGGVVIEECCMRCGCAKFTDSWAQDPEDGEQGLTSTSYEPGKYAEQVRDFRLAKADAIAEEEEEYATDRLVYDAESDDYYLLHLNGGARGAHCSGGNHFPTFRGGAERLNRREAERWLVEHADYDAESAAGRLDEVEDAR